MDDYNLSTIIESKNEWCVRLVTILTPHITEGIKSVFDEAYKMCFDNEEESKYLMTFQNLLNNIPKWSSQVIDEEKIRIQNASCCNYLEDLIMCVHISQLKSLTASRAGIKQKKVDIDIPNLDSFIHKVYINVARKLYTNVYLFEKYIAPLQVQKNNRELEILIKECILNTIRENIPIDNILRIYLDETLETDVEIEETRELIVDEEMVKKQEKEAKQKELEEAKKEAKEKIDRENKIKVQESIKNINKSFNLKDDSTNKNTNKNTNKGDNINTINDNKTNKTNKTNNDINDINDINDNNDINDINDNNDNNDRLTIDTTSLDDSTLKIKSLNEDEDEFNLDYLDLNEENLGNDDIDLNITDLN